MKVRWGLVVIAVNLLALAALVFIYPQFMVSPGPLTPAHAALATDCFACHTPMRGAAAERCTACHALAGIGLRTTKGIALPKPPAKVQFHQSLINQNCVACHGEHLESKLASSRGKRFSHDLLLADVRGQCQSCHAAPKTSIHRSVTTGCADCHTPQAWKPATFDHNKLFPLDGDHKAECVTCHVNNDYSKYTCYGCHEHSPDRIRSKHVKEGIPNFENCVECHKGGGGESSGGGEHSSRRREKD